MRSCTRPPGEGPGHRSKGAGRPCPSAPLTRVPGSLLGVLAGLGIALAAQGSAAQEFQYVITFDKVEVRHADGPVRRPSLAHAERLSQESQSPVPDSSDQTEPRKRPGALPPSSAGGVSVRAEDDRVGGVDPSGRRDRDERSQAGMPQDPVTGFGVGSLAFAPGTGTVNPSFIENGFLVEAFWSVKTGTPEGHFIRAHFHPPELSTGFEAQHWGFEHELHGIYLRAVDHKPFHLKSLRYRVTRNRQIPDRPYSIQGFSNFGVYVLVSTSLDPRWPVRGQFVGFPVGMPFGNDPTLPWWKLPIFGFERVTQVYIASSASVDLEDIVVARWEEAPGTRPEGAPIPDQESARPDQEEPAGPGAESGRTR